MISYRGPVPGVRRTFARPMRRGDPNVAESLGPAMIDAFESSDAAYEPPQDHINALHADDPTT